MTRRKLSERIGLVSPPDEVDMRIPDDPTAEMVKGAAAVAATVQGLVDEHNGLKKKNEWLMRELVVVKNTCTRIEAERDYWRKQAIQYVRANGELAGTIGNMLKLAENANGVLQTAIALADQMPQPGSSLPSLNESVIFDGNGVPLPPTTQGVDVAPEPTHEEVVHLAAKLNDVIR